MGLTDRGIFTIFHTIEKFLLVRAAMVQSRLHQVSILFVWSVNNAQNLRFLFFFQIIPVAFFFQRRFLFFNLLLLIFFSSVWFSNALLARSVRIFTGKECKDFIGLQCKYEIATSAVC
jgi:hypothetical protein